MPGMRLEGQAEMSGHQKMKQILHIELPTGATVELLEDETNGWGYVSVKFWEPEYSSTLQYPLPSRWAKEEEEEDHG